MPAPNDSALRSELMLTVGVILAVLVGGWMYLKKPHYVKASTVACGPAVAHAGGNSAGGYPGPTLIPPGARPAPAPAPAPVYHPARVPDCGVYH